MIDKNFSPYYAVIFITTLNDDVEEYYAMSKKMVELSKTMPGFLGIDSARTDIGITVCYWTDEESIKNWYSNSFHKEAQEKGKEQWFKSLKIRIAKVEREYGF